MSVVFTARIERGTTKDTIGLVVPLEVLEALGRGKRPPVTVKGQVTSFVRTAS